MAWLQPCRGLARGPGPAPGQLSPISIHRPLQMTAWARWSWTSGRTSPSSRIRPASESEPPPRDARRLLPSPPGAFSFLFFFSNFLFCLFCLCPHPSPPSPPFPVFPSALCQTHLSGPHGPASRIPSCPHLCYRPGLGSLSSACPGPGIWAVGEIPVFNQHKAPVRGEAWSHGARGQPTSAQLLLSEAAFLALSSGSEWPGGGQSGPLLLWGRKSNNVQGPGVGE